MIYDMDTVLFLVVWLNGHELRHGHCVFIAVTWAGSAAMIDLQIV